MAYGARDFVRDFALYSAGAAIGPKNTAKFIAYAGKKGIQLAGLAARPVAQTTASLAAANPVAAGAALGLGALQTGPGQALLDAAAVRGAADRIAVQQAIDEAIFVQQRNIAGVQAASQNPVAQRAVKRKATKYGKAIKAGMAAAKRSKFGGKPGKLTNAKATFSTVSKVASAINKGKKVAKTGIRSTIGRAVKKVLK
jgi:hypothetical protein